MNRLFAPVLLLSAVWLATATAQPDRTEALAKAKAKFEQDISKAEDALIASMDKGLKTAGGNKTLSEKITYERELFVSQRIVPTALPAAASTYVRQRAQATAALDLVYLPAIKELAKAKKTDEVEALETALSGLYKTARGYGIGVPDLGHRPPLLIENKAAGLVIETTGKDGRGELVLAPKAGKRKPNQCWYLDRDEKGFIFVNAESGWSFHVDHRFGTEGALSPVWLTKLDAQKDVPAAGLFQLEDARHEVVIASQAKGDLNAFVLTAGEKKQKGVTVYEVTLSKPELTPTPNQQWVITEAK